MIFLKFKNKLLKIFILLLLIIPINAFAYSNYVITGGQTIGIEVHSKGVLVVGFYKIDNQYIAKEAGFTVGDTILKVNGEEVHNIESMIAKVENSTNKAINFTILRDNVEKEITMELLEDENHVLKTGLYVKDKINGIGTLTYIDPESKTFGALGHEILESTTASKFEIKDGEIYDATVSSIVKSRAGNAGEKNATYDRANVYGTISNNELEGIFGTYTQDVSNKEKLEVGEISEIRTGPATIKTVIKENQVEEFAINIIGLDDTSKSKNILFEITDERLLKETGGIVQGMSGSPIIQNNKIIGAVNYVIVNDTSKGYGIFITTMLKEGDKKGT